jgi:hypothetical protein
VFGPLAATTQGRAVLGVLALLVVGVLIGLTVLWPTGEGRFQAITVGGAVQAEVLRVDRESCPQSTGEPCQLVTFRLRDGGDEDRLTLPGTRTAPEVEAGDRIRVFNNDAFAVPGVEPPPGTEQYAFADFERRSPVYLLAALFAVLVIALARWKGVRALAGLAISLVLVTQFMVPAILEGSSPVLVALVGALAVMLVTVGLAHGMGVTSVAAVLGSTAALLVTALLAALFVGLASITGFSSEEASLLGERAVAVAQCSHSRAWSWPASSSGRSACSTT